MDITSRFIEIVCSIDKNFVNKNSNDSNHGKHLDKNRQLSSKLRELVSSITCMRDYIKANARDYANILSSILSISSQMTDNERDQIDKDVQDFIKLGNDVIRILRVELKSKTSKQQYEHEMNAINMVEAYLGSINEMHNQNKQLRLRRKFFTQQFFRIDKNTISNVAQSKPSNNHKFNDETFTEGSKKNLKQSSSHKNGRNGSIPSISSTNRNSKSYNDYYDTNDAAQTITEPLQPEERKQFQLEGKQMYEQLNSMNQEVMSITKKITEISKLQELFSENVLKQQCDLNNLNISTITSNESIREGNEQLREAMRNNAGFRVWILFFITTLAFVILFLDWYNP